MPYTTRHTLLQQMREGDEKAWFAFREFYKPLIATRGRDYRLNADEIEQLVQNVLLAIFREHVLTNYDKSRGKFRDYLRTITSRQAARLIAQRPNARVGVEEGDVAAPEADQRWEAEWREFLMQKALEELKATLDTKAYMAFDLHAIQGRPAAEVARLLDITENQVYLTRTRNVARLQGIVNRLEEELGGGGK